MSLVAYVLTLNEEHNIAAAVRSLREVTDTVVVVDSGSTDGTVEVANSAGAEVWHRPFDNFSAQRTWAINEVIRRYQPDWILSLDADERLSCGLIDEIKSVLHGSTHDAYVIPLRIRFSGRTLRFGGFARSRLLRLFRPDAGSYEARHVNEHFVVRSDASIGDLRLPIVHEDVWSWERHIDKHNRYSTLEAKARLQRRRTGSSVSLIDAARAPHLRRRWLRERIWDRLPGRPALRFLQIYVINAGALDGRAGFRIALFHAWQEMCTDAKYEALHPNPARLTRPTSEDLEPQGDVRSRESS